MWHGLQSSGEAAGSCTAPALGKEGAGMPSHCPPVETEQGSQQQELEASHLYAKGPQQPALGTDAVLGGDGAIAALTPLSQC